MFDPPAFRHIINNTRGSGVLRNVSVFETEVAGADPASSAKLCCRCKIRPRNTQSTQNGSYCRPCRSEVQVAYAKRHGYKDSKERKSKLRQFIIDAKRVPCTDCENSYPWYVMDFDHTQGEKAFNISTAAAKRLSLTKIQNEISKCEVVCANCHRIRTFASSSNRQDNGL